MLSKILQFHLRFWAEIYLNRSKPKIIAITGSVGKTSAKDAIFKVLEKKFKNQVRKSEGNLNNETGLPLAVLNYKQAPTYSHGPLGWLPIIFSVPCQSLFLPKVEVLVLEMAADKPGDIHYLTQIAKPDIAVLTAIAPAHLEAFGSMENIVEEKTSLLRALKKDGLAILNLDNELVKKSSYGGWWQKKTYALDQEADYRALNVVSKIENFQAKTDYEVKIGNKMVKFKQNTLGLVSVLASLPAIAIGETMGVETKEIVAAIGEITSAKHRMRVLKGIKEATILDDCYNANPVSMRAGLKVLQSLPQGKSNRKIVILGDMREIGKNSAQAHQEIGALARQSADLVIAVGKNAKNYNAHKYFLDIEKAQNFILEEIKSGDIILLKASRGGGVEPFLAPMIRVLSKETE